MGLLAVSRVGAIDLRGRPVIHAHLQHDLSFVAALLLRDKPQLAALIQNKPRVLSTPAPGEIAMKLDRFMRSSIPTTR
jgi:hypothetical protein